MNNELEALNIIEDTRDDLKILRDFDDAVALLRKALTPPTADEVCEALSEYLKPYYTRNVKITFKNNEFVFFDRRLVQYIGGNIWFNLPIDFPPHLITLIGRFYEGEIK